MNGSCYSIEINLRQGLNRGALMASLRLSDLQPQDCLGGEELPIDLSRVWCDHHMFPQANCVEDLRQEQSMAGEWCRRQVCYLRLVRLDLIVYLQGYIRGCTISKEDKVRKSCVVFRHVD